MKKLALVLAFACSLWAGPARAEIGTIDAVPAATLLLPYFEVDFANPTGVTTLLTINNASASSALAHVTLWTDEAIPTFNFDIYLTGYDAQIVDLRALFKDGFLPVTADSGNDPGDNGSPTTGISNKGSLSQDINFPGDSGPCGMGTVYASPELDAVTLTHLRRAHTGRRSNVLGGCASASHGDTIARGYITVDSVTECTLSHPSSAGYFAGLADQRNILWGDYTYVDPTGGTWAAGPLVHIESCIPGTSSYIGYVGNGDGAGYCPFAGGDYTFYGRYVGFDGSDQREPLATMFAARYTGGNGLFSNSDLIVWRDTKVAPTGPNGKHHCQNAKPSWFPLSQSDVVAFDESENPADLCSGGECFPLATQRISATSGSAIGDPLSTPFSSGWLFTNLNHDGGNAIPGVAQAWVATTHGSAGRFSVGTSAIALDNANKSQYGPGGLIILP